jgi:hypothetical protein
VANPGLECTNEQWEVRASTRKAAEDGDSLKGVTGTGTGSVGINHDGVSPV